MASIFTKIVNREIPCHKIAEDNKFLAFLDINPNTKGHTLCIPKEEVDNIFDLGEQDYLQLMQFSRQVAKAIERTVPCKRIGIAVVGLEVPHAHVHLIPIQSMDDMTFQKKVSMESEALSSLAKEISENL